MKLKRSIKRSMQKKRSLEYEENCSSHYTNMKNTVLTGWVYTSSDKVPQFVELRVKNTETGSNSAVIGPFNASS